MFKKAKLKKYIKQHSEIFEAGNTDAQYTIDESEIPNMQWFYNRNEHLDEVKKKSAQFDKRWHLSKGLMIPVSLALVLGIFFSTTPTGRAMAGHLYTTVAQWMGTEVTIWHGTDSAPSKDVSEETHTYQSFKQVQSNYNICLIRSKLKHPDLIEVESSEFNTVIKCSYSLSDEQMVKVTQYSSDSNVSGSTTIDISEGQSIQEQTMDGLDIIGNYINGSAHAMIFLDNHTVDISCENTAFEAFTDFLRSLYFD